MLSANAHVVRWYTSCVPMHKLYAGAYVACSCLCSGAHVMKRCTRCVLVHTLCAIAQVMSLHTSYMLVHVWIRKLDADEQVVHVYTCAVVRMLHQLRVGAFVEQR